MGPALHTGILYSYRYCTYWYELKNEKIVCTVANTRHRRDGGERVGARPADKPRVCIPRTVSQTPWDIGGMDSGEADRKRSGPATLVHALSPRWYSRLSSCLVYGLSDCVRYWWDGFGRSRQKAKWASHTSRHSVAPAVSQIILVPGVGVPPSAY